MRRARHLKHGRRKVQAGDDRATRRRGAGNEARAAAQIEHPCSQPDVGRIELGVGELARRGGKTRLIMRRRFLPSGMLEGAHGVRVETHATRVGDK